MRGYSYCRLTCSEGLATSAVRTTHTIQSYAQRHVDFTKASLSVVFFLSPMATSIAPRLTPLFVAVAGAALIIPAMRRGLPWSKLFPYRPALAACLLFVAYVFLDATWSIDPSAGLAKAALLAALVLLSFAAVEAAVDLDKDLLAQAGKAFVAGTVFGALFIATELFTDGLTTRTLVAWFPSLSSLKHFTVEDGKVVALRLSKLDQNVNLMLFHFWPGLLVLMGLPGSRRIVTCLIFILVISIVVGFSEHDSSQVALIGSALVVMGAMKWPTAVIRALAVLWCAAFLLVLPASFAAFDGGWHLSESLPRSARARIIIWQYTAEETLKDPLLGVGVDSTPKLREQQRAANGRARPKDFVYPRTMGHHAHSIYLQSWYELGAIGALLLAIAGAAVVLLMLLLPAFTQANAAGAFTAFAMVGAFAWGMWQSWFLCAVALLPIYIRVASAAERRF